MALMHNLVEPLQECDRLQVFTTAKLIRDPGARLPTVIEVKHGCHGVQPQAVNVIVVQPEERASKQEIRHLTPTIIENDRAPIGMFPLPRIRMFIQMRSVEVTQAMIVARKMSGHPIQDDANPMLV